MSLLAGDTENVWQVIEPRVDPYPLYTSYQISTINKKYRPNTPMKTRTIFKWVFMNIIPAIYSKSLTKYTAFDYYLLILDAYSKVTKLYGMENITTEEVMENLYMFQARFGKVE